MGSPSRRRQTQGGGRQTHRRVSARARARGINARDQPAGHAASAGRLPGADGTPPAPSGGPAGHGPRPRSPPRGLTAAALTCTRSPPAKARLA